MRLFSDIFLFSADEPLIFTRLYFWVFFAVVLAIYSVAYPRLAMRNGYLFIVSLFFYYKTSGLFFLLLVFSTFSDYLIGHAIYRANRKSLKKLFLILSIVINLGVLSYYKYAYFFAETLNNILGTHFKVVDYLALWTNQLTGSSFNFEYIFLPVGISFFTFQTISYAVDVYREKIKPVKSIIDFGFYVSFFPQLVAGPIVRASEFIPQLYRKYRLTKAEFGWAVFLILNGLIKKMIISDYIAVNFVDRIFQNPSTYTGFENLMALYGYTLQVYCDFSGYTDIAIGIALLMGFRLPTNFNSPYKATSVGDFWRRWHISLSTWLRDYLYIPLGGNRFSSFRTNINLMITMLLGGLWHGADMKFIIWGALNGIGLLAYKNWKRISPYEKYDNWLARFWKILLTFNFITFTRIFFRAEDMDGSMAMMRQIFTALDFSVAWEVVSSFKEVFLLMIIGFTIHWIPARWKEKYRGWFILTPIWVKGLVAILTILAIQQARTAGIQPFIYFQF